MTSQTQSITPQATATAWDLDPTHSSAEFEIGHLGISLVSGRFKGMQGSVTLDPARPEAAQVVAEIDAASVDTGVPDRDAHLRSGDFFDVAQHPTIRFVGRHVEKVKGDEGILVGDLTMHGVTREVRLRAQRTGEVLDPWGKRRVGVRAEATLSRKDFGLKWEHPMGAVLGDKVDVTLRLEAVQRA